MSKTAIDCVVKNVPAIKCLKIWWMHYPHVSHGVKSKFPFYEIVANM